MAAVHETVGVRRMSTLTRNSTALSSDPYRSVRDIIATPVRCALGGAGIYPRTWLEQACVLFRAYPKRLFLTKRTEPVPIAMCF